MPPTNTKKYLSDNTGQRTRPDGLRKIDTPIKSDKAGLGGDLGLVPSRHCERSEAIHLGDHRMDCRVGLWPPRNDRERVLGKGFLVSEEGRKEPSPKKF